MTIILALPGAEELLSTAHTSVEDDAINGDQEVEIDNYYSVLEAERTMAPELLSDESNIVSLASKRAKTQLKIDPKRVNELIQEKSRDVVVIHTQQEYAR